MIIRDNVYFDWALDVSEEEEYIKIQKYTLMRNNAEDFLTKHSPYYNVGLSVSKCINYISFDFKGEKILCHTLELATLQNDVFKILNKKNNRGYLYESELLYCFAYPQYPNKITERFESDEEIIAPKLVSNLDKFYALAATRVSSACGFFVLLVAISIFLICTYFN